MAVIRKNRGVQYPLAAEFTFSLIDVMTNVAGTSQAFSATAGVFDVVGLPPGATVTGGEVVVETASNDTGTATIAVGDSASAARYLAATSIKTASRTALGLTGFRTSGEDLRITLANASGNASAGTVTVRVQYVVQDRTNEVQVA